jgi:hypothetical protein
VFNRAIAKRTLFERREDFRHFMALLACSARRGDLELHAFALMGTHYHLLVRSPEGALAAAMQRIQLAYSRRFNRTRRRDDPLVRGRYGSKPVCSLRYRRVLVAYIDANPERAGLVTRSADYPYGSARHYARSSGPPWLERPWVESVVAARSGRPFAPEDYVQAFGSERTRSLASLVERRLGDPATEDPLDDLVGGAPDRVLHWMRRKAELADGTAPGLALVPIEELDRAVREAIHPFDIDDESLRTARIGLARDLCGAGVAEVAAREGLSTGSISRLHGLHRRRVLTDPAYGGRIEGIARGALAAWQDF